MKTYEISVNRHINHYNFEDAESIVSDFLSNVRSKFRASSQVIIKCVFFLENIETTPIETSAPIINRDEVTSLVDDTSYEKNSSS